MRDLGFKILADKINKHLDYIAKWGVRPFDEKIDYIPINVTEKQMYAIQLTLNMKYYDDKIRFKGYKFRFKYNGRMNCYEALAKHESFIENEEENLEYRWSKFYEED